MKKLLKHLGIEDKGQYLRNIIQSGNKENFRALVAQILDNGGDVKEVVDNFEEPKYIQNKEYVKGLLEIMKLEFMKYNYKYIEINKILLKTGLFSELEKKEYIKDLLEKILKKESLSYKDIEIAQSLLETRVLDKEDKEYIKGLLNKVLKEEDFSYKDIELAQSLLETRVLDKEDKEYIKGLLNKVLKKEDIKGLLEKILKKEKDLYYFSYNNITIAQSLLETGMFNKAEKKEYIKDLLKEVLEKVEEDFNYITIAQSLLETRVLDKEDKEYIKGLLEKILKKEYFSYEYTELAQSLLKTRVFNKEDKGYIKGLLEKILKKESLSYIEIAQSLLETGVFNKAEKKEYIKDLLKEVLEKVEEDFNYITIAQSLLETGVFNKKDKGYIKGLLEKILKKESFSYIEIAQSLLETGVFNKEDKGYIKGLLEKILKKEDFSYKDIELAQSLLETGVFDKEDKGYIKDLLKEVLKKVEENFDYVEVVSSLLYTGVFSESEKKEYIKDLLEKILKKESLSYKDIEIAQSLLETGVFNKEDKGYIKGLLNKVLKKEDFSYKDIEIAQSLLEIGVFDKEDKGYIKGLLNKVLEKVEENSEYRELVYYVKLAQSLLETGVFDKEDKGYIKGLLNKVLEKVEENSYHVEIAQSLLETGVFNKEDKGYIKGLLNKVLKKEDFSYKDVKLAQSLLDTGVFDKEYIKDKLKYVLEEGSKKWEEDNFIKISKKLLETGVFNKKENLNYKEVENKYSENIELYNNILNKIKDIKLLNYLDTNFFNIKLLEKVNKFLDYNIDKKIFINNIEKITQDKHSLEFGYFKELILNEKDLPENISQFSVNLNNFTEFMEDGEILIEFEQDKNTIFEGIKPWSKEWFLEKPERKKYLNPKNIKTFKKFGTIIGLGLIEGSESSEKLSIYYTEMFRNISQEKSRSTILQLSEIFNLILKKENYEIFNEIVKGQDIGKQFKEFIEQNSISDKGRTILTLLIAREIRDSFQIWKKDGQIYIDVTKLDKLILGVSKKLEKYNKIIEKYKNIPIKTSIGVEIEVGIDIANAYKEITGSDYKQDIMILSEYAGIAKGNDAVHEIATKPTDNPYLLLLELQLLQDLDFLDLNFKKEGYKKGSRGLHINVGGEKGIKLDNETKFIQNILTISNLGAQNVGDVMIHGGNLYYKNTINKNRSKKGSDSKTDIKLDILKDFTFIRDRGRYDIEKIFGENDQAIEYRSFNIINSENFERLIISIYNLNMAYQAYKQDFKNELGKRFKKLKDDILEIIEEHNKNFVENEIGGEELDEELLKILNIINKRNILLKKIGKKQPTERQERILKGYDNIIGKYKDKIEILKKLENIDYKELQRKLTNRKRFKEVINGDIKYLESIKIKKEEFFETITAELINKFTRINNLFIKKDSTNALAMYSTTREGNNLNDNSNLLEYSVFDRIDRDIEGRKGAYVIQGASKDMITYAIQKRILEFNEETEELLKNFN